VFGNERGRDGRRKARGRWYGIIAEGSIPAAFAAVHLSISYPPAADSCRRLS
jgi:hypothetical protein